MNLSDLSVDRALVVGDMHGNLFAWQRTILPAFRKTNADIIIQVGDYGIGWNPDYLGVLDDLLEAEGADVYWIDGNHENFDLMERLGIFPNKTEPQSTSERTTYVPRGYAWEWGGKRVFAMGGAYSVDKFYRTPHKSWWPQEEITYEDLERGKRVLGGDGADVFLAHDCFEGIRVPGVHADWKQDEFAEVCRANREKLRELVDRARPELFIHGHMHSNYSQNTWPGVGEVIGLNCEDMVGSCITLDFPSLAWAWAS